MIDCIAEMPLPFNMIDIIQSLSAVEVFQILCINKMEELHSLDIVTGAFTICCETCQSLFPFCVCPYPFNCFIITTA